MSKSRLEYAKLHKPYIWENSDHCLHKQNFHAKYADVFWVFFIMGAFNNYEEMILLSFDHPPTSVDILYVLNVDKNGNC